MSLWSFLSIAASILVLAALLAVALAAMILVGKDVAIQARIACAALAVGVFLALEWMF